MFLKEFCDENILANRLKNEISFLIKPTKKLKLKDESCPYQKCTPEFEVSKVTAYLLLQDVSSYSRPQGRTFQHLNCGRGVATFISRVIATTSTFCASG